MPTIHCTVTRNQVLGGLLGVCIGDALGVPVEFQSRHYLKNHPVTDMRGYGTYNQPPGTWSDDSSLTLCLVESLCHGFSLQDLAQRFIKWLNEGYWTPYGEVFDVGNTTKIAIENLIMGVPPTQAGPADEYSNGNGSLMRILPLAFFLYDKDRDAQFSLAHQVSCLTHGHLRSQMACGMYIQMAIQLLNDYTPLDAYKKMKDIVSEYYFQKPFIEEYHHFMRITDMDIQCLPEEEIQSSGYVIHTLEASLWCLLNNNNYANTVLAAVNLGQDTETTAAVAGGLAGIFYGYENLPSEWINQLARADDIIHLGEKLYRALYGS